MKELLLRLRHWLIKKLGGYTEQEVIPPIRVCGAATLPIDRVVMERAVDIEDIPPTMGEDGMTRWVKDGFARELAQKIVEGAGVMSCQPFPWERRRVYRMTVCLVRPEHWLKTSLGDVESRHMIECVPWLEREGKV